MRKFYSYVAAAFLTVSSLTAFAADEGVTITWDPTAGSTLSEFPETFTIKFECDTEVAKNSFGNPIKVTAPSATSAVQCTGTFDATTKTLTVTTNKAIDRTIKGDYTVELVAGAVNYLTPTGETNEDGSPVTTKVKCNSEIIKYTVGKVAGPTGPVASGTDGITYTFDPPLGVVDEFPETFTITVEGCASIKKPFSGNPVRVQAPGSASFLACTAIWGTNTITLTANKSLDRTKSGDYKVQIIKDAFSYLDENGTVLSKAVEMDYTYTVEGEIEVDPSLTEVQYDIQLSGMVPNIIKDGLDVKNKTFEIVQFIFNMSNLKPVEGATVNIKGPGYNQTVPLYFKMGNETSTWINANFPYDPIYDGEYTLTIAKGVIGNELYLTDPEKGHTNDAISFTFEVTGGKDPSEMTIDTSFSPVSVTPTPQSKIPELSQVKMTFEEKVYFDEKTELTVGQKEDLANLSYTNIGVATISRISDTEIELVVDPAIKGGKQLCIKVPEGTFWNQDHEDGLAKGDEYAGLINAATTYEWYYKSGDAVTEVSTTPAPHSSLTGFPTGYQIIINTTNNDVVAKMTFNLKRILAESESASEQTVISSTTTTEKTADGEICWTNEGDPINFSSDYSYTLYYSLYNADGEKILESSVEFEGADPVVIPEVKFISASISENELVENIAAGSDLVVNTDNNAAVSKWSFSIAEKDSDKPLVEENDLTSKNSEGALCWTATEDVVFMENTAYVLSVAGYFEDGTELFTAEVNFDGKTSSLAGITIDSKDAVIFNLQGIKVNTEIKNLPAGLYIINGKKVMIRK